MSETLLTPITGLTNSKLLQATATPNDVLSGKTFYAGNNILQTGISVDTKVFARIRTISTDGYSPKVFGGEYENNRLGDYKIFGNSFMNTSHDFSFITFLYKSNAYYYLTFNEKSIVYSGRNDVNGQIYEAGTQINWICYTDVEYLILRY